MAGASDNAVEATRFQAIQRSAEEYEQLAAQFVQHSKRGIEGQIDVQQAIDGLTRTGTALTKGVDQIRASRTKQQSELAESVKELKSLIATVPLIRISSLKYRSEGDAASLNTTNQLIAEALAMTNKLAETAITAADRQRATETRDLVAAYQSETAAWTQLQSVINDETRPLIVSTIEHIRDTATGSANTMAKITKEMLMKMLGTIANRMAGWCLGRLSCGRRLLPDGSNPSNHRPLAVMVAGLRKVVDGDLVTAVPVTNLAKLVSWPKRSMQRLKA